MIGETCKKLPDDIKDRYPNIPWRQMTGFRNFVSHDYFGIDANLVWKAAEDLEPVRAMVEEELRRIDQGS